MMGAPVEARSRGVLDARARRVVETYRDLALAALPPGRIERIVLFGSRARGEAGEDSDWDMAVFLDRAPTWEDRKALSGAGFRTMERTGELIQSLPLGPEEWRAGHELVRHLRREGIAVYG
jgi:predicted nucleotidyltransferase